MMRPNSAPISWQSRIVHLLVRARMRPHTDAQIDPLWVRREMGKPRAARRWMARSTGATMELRAAGEGWPGGEVVSWPGHGPEAPVLLYLHGGGYIACSPETHRPLVSSLVSRVRGRAFVPRYRLAPEHPFPAALDDALAAYRFLLEVERVAPEQIVLVGDSAGGGLALALAMAMERIESQKWSELTKRIDCPARRIVLMTGQLRRSSRLKEPMLWRWKRRRKRVWALR